MRILVYLIPAILTCVMLINGAMRYWGCFDRESAEALFCYYYPTKREERNWKLSQKIYGKYLLIAGVLNIFTELVLVPVTNYLLNTAESLDTMSVGMLLVTIVPGVCYMFAAWGMMQLKLKRIEDKDVEK